MERWRWHEERRKGPAERENGKGAGGGFEEEWRYSSVIVGHESRFTQISNRLCTMFLIDSNLFTGSGSGVVLLPHSKGLGILGISRLFFNDRTGSLRTKTDFLWGETQTANVNFENVPTAKCLLFIFAFTVPHFYFSSMLALQHYYVGVRDPTWDRLGIRVGTVGTVSSYSISLIAPITEYLYRYMMYIQQWVYHISYEYFVSVRLQFYTAWRLTVEDFRRSIRNQSTDIVDF